MDRWSWADETIYRSAVGRNSVGGVSLYDGDNKTTYVNGSLGFGGTLIFWKNENTVLSMPVNCVVLAEDFIESSFFSKKYFAIIHLAAAPPDKLPGPVTYSQFHQIRLKVKSHQALNDVLSYVTSMISKAETGSKTKTETQKPSLNLRGGLYQIEQDMQLKDAALNRDIADAFQDFKKLMNKAGEMVELAKKVSEKAKKQSRQSSGQDSDTLSAEDLIEFRSDLMNIGVGNATKDSFSSESAFHKQLASEMVKLLQPILMKTGGGLMSLTDAYCRLNRARGLDLVSPDDVLAASRMMDKLNLPLRLHMFSTGVRCLRLAEMDSKRISSDTYDFVKSQLQGCTIHKFSTSLSLPMSVARERMLAAECEGFLCRDETASGLSFYPNRFLLP